MLNRLGAVVSAFVAASTVACALLGLTNIPAAAQSSATKRQSRAAKTDLSGVWITASGVYDYAAFGKDEPPMTSWGQAQFAAAKPSQGSHGVKLTETNDKVYKCSPPGVPYIYIQIFPMQIIQTLREVIEFFEYDHIVRYIYTDGRQHPADLQPSYNGHSVGHWEGDTLVVDTVGLNGKNWLDRLGHPESSEMHIVEHIRRVDAKNLEIDLTFDDAKSYTKHWSARIGFVLHPEWDILEHVCEDNLAFESFEH
jgi:hypothetical protein